jgi:PAS domain S-box-containing protein
VTGAEESAEDLFENAPCGYLSCRPDGTILRVNRTFEAWTGFTRDALLGRRFRELLAPAGRIYHETHYLPVSSCRDRCARSRWRSCAPTARECRH